MSSGGMSNMNELQDHLEATLSSALDLSKLTNVFSTLIGVIKDQQAKISNFENDIKELYGKLNDANEAIIAADKKTEAALAAVSDAKAELSAAPADNTEQNMPPILHDRIAELESKFSDIHNHLFGDPNEKPPEIISMEEILFSKDPIEEVRSRVNSARNSSRRESNPSIPYQQLKKQIGSNANEILPSDVPYGLEITISRPNTPFTEVTVQTVPQLSLDGRSVPTTSRLSSRLKPVSELESEQDTNKSQHIVINTKSVPSIPLDPMLLHNNNGPQDIKSDTRRSRAPSASGGRVSFREALPPARLAPTLVRPTGEVDTPVLQGESVVVPRQNAEPLTIVKKNEDGTYDIKTSDGQIEKGVSKKALQKEFVPGTQVMLPQKQQLKQQPSAPAVVLKQNSDGTVDVKMPSGEVLKGVKKSDVEPVQKTFVAGEHAESIPAGPGGKSSPVVIEKVNDDGTYDIKSSDGKVEKGVSQKALQKEFLPDTQVILPQQLRSASAVVLKQNSDGTVDVKMPSGEVLKGVKKSDVEPVQKTFAVGEHVESIPAGPGGKSSPVVIEKVNDDGTYDIKHGDGRVEKRVSPKALQKEIVPGTPVMLPQQQLLPTPAVVLKTNEDGTVDVKTSSGEVLKGVKKSDVEPQKTFAVGERVESIATGPQKSVLLAVVERINDDGTYDIKYGDGYIEKGVPKEALFPPRPPVFANGDKVQCRPMNRGRLLPATVQINSNGTADVKYDNGTQEFGVKMSNLQAAKPDLKGGDKIRHEIQKPGVIQKRNDNGTFDVRFDDGTTSKNVRIADLKSPVSNFTAGNRIMNIDKLKSGYVTGKNGDGTFNMKYDDGKLETGVDNDALTVGPTDISAGVKVSIPGKRKVGTISKVNDKGSFDVSCDDGSVEKNIPRESLAACPVELLEEDRVCNLLTGVPGVVLRQNPEGTLYVKYDNGDIDKKIAKALLSSAQPDLFVGETVEVKKPKNNDSSSSAKAAPLLTGKIVSLNVDGSYKVKYDDSPTEHTVSRRDIRPTEKRLNDGEKVSVKHIDIGTITKRNADGTANVQFENGKEGVIRTEHLQPFVESFKLGDKITVVKDGPMPGSVIKVNDDNTVDIQYANGEVVHGVRSSACQNVLPDFIVGDKVDFSSAATAVGKVAQKHEDGTVDIQLSDGTVQKNVNEHLVMPKTFHAAGEVVETDPTGKGDWVPGVVVKAFEDGSYEIDYDIPAEINSDIISSTRSKGSFHNDHPLPPAAKAVHTVSKHIKGDDAVSELPYHPSHKYRKGDTVVAIKEGKWMPGKINRVYGNGNYDISFDNGTTEVGLTNDQVSQTLPPTITESQPRSGQVRSEPSAEKDQVQISIKLPASITQPGSKTFNYTSPRAQPQLSVPAPVPMAPIVPPVAIVAPTSFNTDPSTISVGSIGGLLGKRRQMRVENLTKLSPAKRFKLVRMLRRKGMFIQISKKMLHDARQKYSNTSLKNKVDYLETELRTLTENSFKLRRNLKKSNAAVKDLLPQNFDQMYANMCVLLGAVQSIGGPNALIHNLEAASKKKDKRRKAGGKNSHPHHAVADYDSDEGYHGVLDLASAATAATAALTEELHQQKALTASLNDQIAFLHEKLEVQEKKTTDLPDASDIVRYGTANNLSDKDISYITDKLRSTILHEYELRTTGEMNKLKERLIDFSSEAFTRSDLVKMLQPPNPASATDSSAVDAVTDPHHTRLVDLINRSVDLYYRKVELSKKQYSSIAMGPSSKDLEEISAAGQKHTDQRLKKMMEVVKSEIHNTNTAIRSRADKLEVDIAMIQDNMDSLLSNQMNLMKVSMDLETRKRESAIIRELQKKMAAYSTEKLIDDIKGLQKDMKEKPSAHKVSEMLALVEHSFTSNIGAGMVGMRSYIEQLYQAVQHKVNREDIRALINAKVAQLEHEMVQKEEEMHSMASTTRCLSCGQNQSDIVLKKLNRVAGSNAGDNISTITSSTGNKPPGSAASSVEIDDELSRSEDNLGDKGSLHSKLMSKSAPLVGLQSASEEEIQSLLSGNAGLKPLLVKHTPVQMTASVPHQAPSSSSGSRRKGEKLPDPLYLKAKLAAHMKEMVKADNTLKKQSPMYVLEDDSNSVGTLGTISRTSSRAPTRGTATANNTGDAVVLPAIGGNNSKSNTFF